VNKDFENLTIEEIGYINEYEDNFDYIRIISSEEVFNINK